MISINVLRDSPYCYQTYLISSQIAEFMRPTWGPPGSCRPQMGPMLAPWTLLSGLLLRVWRIWKPCWTSSGHCLWSLWYRFATWLHIEALIEVWSRLDWRTEHNWQVILIRISDRWRAHDKWIGNLSIKFAICYEANHISLLNIPPR